MKKTKRRKHKHQEEKPGHYQKNEYGLHPKEKKAIETTKQYLFIRRYGK